jgi:DNA-binding response OmpR family regulator
MTVSKPRLLIVDDERDILSPYGRFMRAKGFEVFEATTIAQALALARAERPALALVDLFMEGKEAGFKLCRDLTDLPSPPSVFLMTSVMTKFEHRLQAYEAGAAHFLIKPHNLSILERDIRFFLSEPRPASTVGATSHERSDGPRVLIVDDDEEGSRAVSHVLKSEGFAPFTAATGAQGLMLAHKLRPQAIVLDYLLPDTDGRELISWLRAHPRTQNVPIVMLTSIVLPQLKLDTLPLKLTDT